MSLGTITAVILSVMSYGCNTATTNTNSAGPGGLGIWTTSTPDIYWGITGDSAAFLDFDSNPTVRHDFEIFYQYELGFYPQLQGNKEVRGGIPQRADMPRHLERLVQQIKKRIPAVDYDGVAVIDYESWHPLWHQTPQIYRDASIEYAREGSPHLSPLALEQLAKSQYEEAARKFMVSTIRRAKQLRPDATWGYFGFPRLRIDPQELAWLFDECDAIFPVIYGDWASQPEPNENLRQASPKRFQRVIDRIMAGAHTASDNTNRDLPVIPFLSLRYRPRVPIIGGDFLNYLDLETMMQRPGERGAAGLVLWDSVDSFELADEYNNYLRGMLAPALVNE